MSRKSWLQFSRSLATTRRQERRRTSSPVRGLLLEQLENRIVLSADYLYVGDGSHSTVEQFDAASGEHLGTFVAGNKSLKGPRGMVFDSAGDLLLANQNAGRGKSGEIMRYDGQTGDFVDEVVPFQDPNAPFAPRGIVLQNGILYVASLQEGDTTKDGLAPDGRIARYDATTGKFLGNLTNPIGLTQQFNPRGVVFGPDGSLYVAVFDSSNPMAGHILKYDVSNGAMSVFATNDGDGMDESGEAVDLHRPEGLTFGPDGRLYVTSFRANAMDTDKIVILNGTTGAQEDTIPLDAVGQPRAFAQAIVFGPDDDLFVPIIGNGPDTGAVRRYDVDTKEFENFLAPGTLGEPWYLTFGQTDPATLAYVDSVSPSEAAASSLGLAAWALVATPGDDVQLASSADHQEQDRMDVLAEVVNELQPIAGHDHEADSLIAEVLTEIRAASEHDYVASLDDLWEQWNDHLAVALPGI